MNRQILLFDTTLRDGEQAPGFSMNIEEKLSMAKQLARLGVDVIEAGFPISSEGDFEAVRTVAREVRGPVIAGLARAVTGDIDRCWAAVCEAEKPRIHTFIATSDIHITHKFKTTRKEILKRAVKAVRHGASSLSSRSPTRLSSLARVILMARCLGPLASAVIKGRLTSVCMDEDSSIFAFSAASFNRCNAILSFLRSIPCSFLNSSER